MSGSGNPTTTLYEKKVHGDSIMYLLVECVAVQCPAFVQMVVLFRQLGSADCVSRNPGSRRVFECFFDQSLCDRYRMCKAYPQSLVHVQNLKVLRF